MFSPSSGAAFAQVGRTLSAMLSCAESLGETLDTLPPLPAGADTSQRSSERSRSVQRAFMVVKSCAEPVRSQWARCESSFASIKDTTLPRVMRSLIAIRSSRGPNFQDLKSGAALVSQGIVAKAVERREAVDRLMAELEMLEVRLASMIELF